MRLILNILTLLLVAATPALCGGADPKGKPDPIDPAVTLVLKNAHNEFQSIKANIYQTAYDRLSTYYNVEFDYEAAKRKRILAYWDDKTWVERNIIQIVDHKWVDDNHFLAQNLDKGLAKTIRGEQIHRDLDTMWKAMGQMYIPFMFMRDHKYPATEECEKELRAMRDTYESIKKTLLILQKSIEKLELWHDQGKKPFSMVTYMKAIATGKKQPNTYWVQWYSKLERWRHDNRGLKDDAIRKIDQLGDIPAAKKAASKVYTKFELEHAQQIAFNQLINLGLRKSGLKTIGFMWSKFEWTRRFELLGYFVVPSGNTERKLVEARKGNALIRGEGMDVGFGLHELLKKGLRVKQKPLAKWPTKPVKHLIEDINDKK